MRFRLVWYVTMEANKYAAEDKYEFLGDRDSIWRLWYTLKRVQRYPHVEVYSLSGERQDPANGLNGMQDYNNKGQKRVATAKARIILALSALEEARLLDLFAFFKAQGSVMTSSSMRTTLFDMKRLGWVRIEKRKGENWYSLS